MNSTFFEIQPVDTPTAINHIVCLGNNNELPLAHLNWTNKITLEIVDDIKPHSIYINILSLFWLFEVKLLHQSLQGFLYNPEIRRNVYIPLIRAGSLLKLFMQHLSSFIAIWESLIVIYQRLLEGPLCAENVGWSISCLYTNAWIWKWNCWIFDISMNNLWCITEFRFVELEKRFVNVPFLYKGYDFFIYFTYLFI